MFLNHQTDETGTQSNKKQEQINQRNIQ